MIILDMPRIKINNLSKTMLEFREFVEKMHENGMFYQDIAKSLGVSKANLYNKLRHSSVLDADFYLKFLELKKNLNFNVK